MVIAPFIARAITGAATLANPLGVPRLRNVIQVPPRLPIPPGVGGLHRERPLRGPHHEPLAGDVLDDLVGIARPAAEELRHEGHPRAHGHRRRSLPPTTELMLAYHSGALSGSPAYAATCSRG